MYERYLHPVNIIIIIVIIIITGRLYANTTFMILAFGSSNNTTEDFQRFQIGMSVHCALNFINSNVNFAISNTSIAYNSFYLADIVNEITDANNFPLKVKFHQKVPRSNITISRGPCIASRLVIGNGESK